MFKSSKFYKDMKRVVTIAIVACFSLLIFMGFIMNFNKIVNKHNELNVSAAYDFSVSSAVELKPNDSNYKNNSEFEISNKKGLGKFALSVYNGCTFAGKTVKLTKSFEYVRDYDIDSSHIFRGIGYPTDEDIELYTDYGSNPPISAFCGTFDGCGFTVSNFHMRLKYKMTLQEWDDDVIMMEGDGYLGFFGVLADGAVVKNLRLENLSYYIDEYEYSFSSGTAYVGAIAGYIIDGAEIYNCEVSGFYVRDGNGTDENGRDEYIGGLVGRAAYSNKNQVPYKIRDCYVENFQSTVHSNENWLLPYYNYWDNSIGAFVGRDTVFHDSGGLSGGYYTNLGQIIKCVLNNKDSFKTADKSGFDYGIGYSDQTDYDANGIFLTKQDDYSKLGSDISIGGEDEGDYWYWAEDYNDGYPRLRQFISSWKTVTFNSNPEKSATFNETSIQIPGTANEVYSSGGSTIEIYNRVITAIAEPGYKILGWTCNSATSYTVNCELIPFKLTFTNVSSFATMKVDGTIKTSDTMELNYGSVVNFSSEVDNGISTYTYEISNAGNVLKTITYTTKSKKYTMGIDNNKNLINGLNGSNTYEIVFSDGVTSKRIVPNFVLKNYDFILK